MNAVGLARRLPLALLLLAFLVRSAAAADPAAPPASSDILKLPDLTITGTPDLPPPESWHYARIEGFEVLSNASEKATRDLLADFQKFRQGVRLIWPVPPKPLAAASLILCRRQNKFDQFVPAGTAGDAINRTSLLLRNREQVAIIVDLEADNITVDDPTVLVASGTAALEYSVDHYSQLYREYVHFLLSQVDARPPAWLEEGLAQIVMDIELTDTALIYGKVNSDKGGATGSQYGELDESDPGAGSSAIVGEQPFNVVLQHQKLMPLDRFFAVTHDSPEAQNPLGNNLWAKQAYLFVHFCLFGENLRYKDALGLFLQRLAREPASDALFKECFKVGYADMAKQLRGYILHTRHKYQKYPLKADDRLTAKSIELRDATPIEADLIKGDALRLGGHLDAAATAYRTAYLRGGRDPALLAAFGEAENAAGRADRARQLLEAATKANVTRPSAYVELARLRLAAATAAPAVSGKLDVAQVSSVLTPLFNARKLPPPLPETYELIADAWALSSAPPTAGNLGVLDEGIRLFPRDSTLLYRAAQLNSDFGDKNHAAQIARLGLRFSADPEAKARFEQLIASLPAAATK